MFSPLFLLPDLKAKLAAVFGLLFLAAAIAMSLRRLISNRPALTIATTGVDYPAWGVGLIPWQDILAIKVQTVKTPSQTRQRIVFQLRNSNDYESRIPFYAKFSSVPTQASGLPPFGLECKGLTVDLQTVLRFSRL